MAGASAVARSLPYKRPDEVSSRRNQKITKSGGELHRRQPPIDFVYVTISLVSSPVGVIGTSAHLLSVLSVTDDLKKNSRGSSGRICRQDQLTRLQENRRPTKDLTEGHRPPSNVRPWAVER